jgi:hypothetical protein
VKSLPTKADRGASLAEIPTDARSNFEAAAEAKEAHGWRMQSARLRAKSASHPHVRMRLLFIKNRFGF